MKTWFWIVLVAFLLLAGYVVWNSGQRPKKQAQPPVVAFEVSAESTAAYEQSVAELEA
jgi:tryptophan-rich sensory protein